MENGLPDPAFLPSQVQRTKIRLPAPTFLPPQVHRTKISHTARPKLVFRHYVNLFQKLEIFGNDRKAQLVEMYYKEQLWNYQVALQKIDESLKVFKSFTKNRLTFSHLETKYLENIESAINDTKK